MKPATLIRVDEDDPGQPIEYAIFVPGPCPVHDVEIGRIWLDTDTQPAGWVAVPADKTAPRLGRHERGIDAVLAVIHHHDGGA